MKKRILSIMLTLCMVLTFVPTVAFAETNGDFTYSVSGTNEVTITRYDDYLSHTTVTIPDKINDKSVTAIGECAFAGSQYLESITIPSSVTSIGNGAFDTCYELESVTFEENSRLQSIGSSAFQSCNLTSINIPGSVTSIGSSAFHGCHLSSVNIPGSVTSIGTSAFRCRNLTGITVDPNNSNYSSEDGVLFNKDKTELIHYPAGNTRTSYSIPDSVTSIGNEALRFCNRLESVAFGVNSKLESIGVSAFQDCENLESINIPNSATSIGEDAFHSCTRLTSVIIPNNVTVINERTFSECNNLESIFLPDKVSSIGTAAIPDTTSQARYSLDTNKGEVTITEITLAEGKIGVAIPEKICGYPVVAVAENVQSNVGEHTHKGGTATYTSKAVCDLCGKEYGGLLYHYVPSKTDTVSFDKDGNVTVTIEKSIVTVGGKAEVTVSESIADTILSKLASSSSKKVIINATTAKNTASKPVLSEPGTSTHINLPESAVKKLAEVEGIEITIVTDNGKVVLDKETIAAVAAKAGNDGQVTLVIETVEQNNNLLKIELKIKTSNGDVTDFNKGNVKVTVAVSEVLKGKKPVCVYIDEDGRYHKIGGTLNADGTFTFVAGHFSTYAIMAEEETDTVIAQQKEEILAALADQKLAARSKLVTMKNGKKAVKITWYNKDGEIMDFDGVQIFRSTKKNSGYGKKPISTSATGKYYNTAIKSGTRYYYRVRGFVIIEGQKYYTDYSLKAIRTVK